MSARVSNVKVLLSHLFRKLLALIHWKFRSNHQTQRLKPLVSSEFFTKKPKKIDHLGKMDKTESTWSNEVGLIEDPDITNSISDAMLELTNVKKTGENVESQLVKASFEDDEIKEELGSTKSRTRKLTEKGKQERIRKLRNDQITALKAVSRKRTEITKLRSDQNNLEVVKNQLTELDRLCQNYQDCYNEYQTALSSPEDKEEASAHFEFKEIDIFEYRNGVANWIATCEQRLSDQFDNLSGHHSRKSCSNSSRSSRNSKNSLMSAHAKEKIKSISLRSKIAWYNFKLHSSHVPNRNFSKKERKYHK